MKKFCLIFVFLLCVFNAFAQNNSVVEQTQKGDLTLLDAEIRISDFELAQMDNTELRLLRNMIYAKYGHSLIRQMLKIGSYEYFLYSNNVNTMGDWARKY